MKLFQKYEDTLQLLSGLLAATLVGWLHAAQGDPWWYWLPLALLTMIGVQAIWVIVWFLRRKLTYQQHAAANKSDLRSGGNGWPRHRSASH
jgi:hypothetical protein